MNQAKITASPKVRVIFVVAAIIMLALWGLSLIPPIENWNNPNEDGFSYVPAFYATITCLPVGLYLVAGAIAGRGRPDIPAHRQLAVRYINALVLGVKEMKGSAHCLVTNVRFGSLATKPSRAKMQQWLLWSKSDQISLRRKIRSLLD